MYAVNPAIWSCHNSVDGRPRSQTGGRAPKRAAAILEAARSRAAMDSAVYGYAQPCVSDRPLLAQRDIWEDGAGQNPAVRLRSLSGRCTRQIRPSPAGTSHFRPGKVAHCRPGCAERPNGNVRSWHTTESSQHLGGTDLTALTESGKIVVEEGVAGS